MKKLNQIDKIMLKKRKKQYKEIRKLWKGRDQASPYLKETIRVSTLVEQGNIFMYGYEYNTVTNYAMKIMSYENHLCRLQKEKNKIKEDLKKKSLPPSHNFLDEL